MINKSVNTVILHSNNMLFRDNGYPYFFNKHIQHMVLVTESFCVPSPDLFRLAIMQHFLVSNYCLRNELLLLTIVRQISPQTRCLSTRKNKEYGVNLTK